jgi:Tol biopolymer transport system component
MDSSGGSARRELLDGSRFGAYEVLGLLGRGGMGEVYRVRDSALGRDVALKILPGDVARDPDRTTRFKREAQLLAALNHPNIAAIYGLTESDGLPALVLELVEGPTLDDRLRQQPLTVDAALRVARQIADALAAAHQQGIVHRDLKPANVKVRPDGTVKVLDFGLAKALAADPDVGRGMQSGQSASPTITASAATRRGMVLGTPAYMSPEQALADRVDRGADIWAFGCVLYEMLTGARAFAGASDSETIAAVIRAEPDWSRLPGTVPAGVHRLLRRCLDKNRDRRLADIRDARLDVDDSLAGDPAAAGPVRVAGTVRGERWIWATAVLLLAVAAVGALLWRRGSAPPPAATRRVEISTPPTIDQVSLALSPDGRHLAFVALTEGRSRLWLRSLESGQVRLLPDTDGAAFPFWSPDSRTIGFFAGEKINRVDIDAGSPKAIGQAVVPAGGTWSRDGVILHPMVPDSPIFAVPAAGGGLPAPTPGSIPPRGREPGHRFPQFLPDGRRFLYFVVESKGVFLGSLDGPERRRLFDSDAAAVLAPAHVLFVRQGSLFAQPFDPVRAELTGEPSRLADGIAVDAVGAAAVSASAEGTIAFRTGSANQARQFVWVDRGGKQLGSLGDPDAANPTNPALSHDGRYLAFTRSVAGNADVWLYDLDRTLSSRVTTNPLPDITPIWSPDDVEIVFSRPADTTGLFGLFARSRSTGAERRLSVPDNLRAIAMDWSRDGRVMIARDNNRGHWDIWALQLGPEPASPRASAVAQTAFDERTAQLSPDGRWIAYESNEPGRFEVFVQAFPGPGAKVPVSAGGGSQPRWRSDGAELYYVSPDGQLNAVAVRLPSAGQAIVVGKPFPLFQARIDGAVRGGTSYEYAVAAGGQRFLLNSYAEPASSPITLILNAFER